MAPTRASNAQREVQAAIKKATHALQQQMEALRVNHKRTNGGGGKGGGGGGGDQGGRNGGAPPGAPLAKKPKTDPNANDPGTGKFDGRSWNAQAKHLAETVGEYDGKAPCIFHHTPGFTCKHDADPASCVHCSELFRQDVFHSRNRSAEISEHPTQMSGRCYSTDVGS